MKFWCSVVFVAVWSCVSSAGAQGVIRANQKTTARQRVTIVARNGTRQESTREIEFARKPAQGSSSRKAHPLHGAPALLKASPTLQGSRTGTGKVHPSLLPGYPNATINSQYFGSTAVGQTSDTITLTYPYPSGVTEQNLTFASGSNGFFGQATCNYPQPCTAPLAFQPSYPGLTTNAVISKDQNGNIIYETLLYAMGTAPQLGFDLGDLTIQMGVTNQPGHVAVGPDGSIYLTDPSQNAVYQIASDFSSQTQLSIAGLGTPGGIAVDGAGTLYIADKTNNVIVAYNEANAAQTTVTTSQLSNPNGVAVDGAGNLYIADTGNNRIIEIDIQGNEFSIAEGLNSPTSIAVDGAGDVFYVDAGNGGELTVQPSDGDAYSLGQQLGTLYDIALDAARTVYISTSTGLTLIGTGDYGIGETTTFGGGPNYGMALDPAGDVITTQPANGSVSVTNRTASNFILTTPVGTTTSGGDIISNTGTDPLTITNIAISGTVFTDDGSDGCFSNLTIQPGFTCQTVVDFSPTAAQQYLESYEVTSNSLNMDDSATNIDVLYGNGTALPTTTALSIAPSPATVGQTVVLTATVSRTADSEEPLPTGTVNFFDGMTMLGSGDLSSGGIAQFSTSSLAAGTHDITAQYAGDSINAQSSNVQSLVVNAGSSTNTLGIVPAALSFGNQTVGTTSAPQTVTVTNNGTTTVTIASDSDSDPADFGFTQTCGGPLAAGASCTFTITFHPTSAGALSETVTLNDDAAGSPQTVVVTGTGVAVTTTTLSVTSGGSAVTTVASGSVVTLTAAVVVGTAPVSGQVAFCDASATTCTDIHLLATAQITSAGTAMYSFVPGIGSHSYKAVFLGTSSDAGSASSAAALAVTGQYATTTTLASSGVQGSYALTATVDGLGAGSPSGNVLFTDSSTNGTLGTMAVTGVVRAFVPGSPISAGSSPNQVVPADVNGDGKPDLVVGNQSGTMLTVLIGNGDGTYNALPSFGTNYDGITGLCVADFNGDGKLDIATGNGSTVGIFLGNGDGTFGAEQDFANAASSKGVYAADFNGDGILDLAVTDNNYGISILIGNGDGTFTQSGEVLATGNGPNFQVAVADFNKDGKLDIAYGNYYDATLGVLLGNGDGTFQAQTTYPIGAGPRATFTGDFNGDGNPDIVVTNGNGASVSVLLGNGDGTFQAQQSFAVGSNPSRASVGDLNGDGKLDIAVANENDGTVSILFGNGDGSFQAQQVLTVGDSPDDVAIRDVNGDGSSDLEAVNLGDNTVTVLLNRATAAVSLTGVTLPGSGSDNVVATYGGDTLFTGSTSNTLTLPSNPAAMTTPVITWTPAVATIPFGTPLGASQLNASAATPAGAPILGTFVYTPAAGTVLPVGTQTLSVTFTPTDTTDYTMATKTATIMVTPAAVATTVALTITPTTVVYESPVSLSAKVTGSDDSTVVVGQVIFCDAAAASCNPLSNLGVAQLTANNNGAAILKLAPGIIGTHNFKAVFLGTTAYAAATSAAQSVTVTGTYPTSTAISASGTGGSYNLTGTVTGLGTRTVGATGTVSFLDTSNANASLGSGALGAATLGFGLAQPAGSPMSAGSAPYGQATGDFNGDGFQDVVAELYAADGVVVLLGNGDGTFQQSDFFEVGYLPERVLVADLNGDGKLDLIVANTGSESIGVLLGNGDGTFQQQVTYPCGSPVGLGVMDINHDGYPDVVAGDYYDGTISVLLGNGDGTLKTAVTYPTGSTPQTVAEGDFNGDGNVDVVVGNFGGASVGIFLGNGDGTFQTMVTYPAGNQPQGVQVGDFNGDGKQDLAVSNSADGTVGVLLGNGDGTFQTQVTYPVGTGPVGLVIGDFNGDGFQDLSVGNTGSNTQSVLLGNGDGTFQTQLTFPTGTDPYGAATGDFNGDGYPDISVSNFVDGTVTTLLSQVTRTATAAASVNIGGGVTTMHNVEASYPGDTNFSASVSPTTALTGGGTTAPAASTTTLAITPAQATAGQSVTFSVTVAGSTQTTPVATGTVALMNTAVTPNTVLGTITLGASGTGTFSTTALPQGTYSVDAVYSGDTNYAASTSAVEPLVVTANGCPVPGSSSNSMNIAYFTLAESDLDANYFPINSVSSNYVLPALGTNGLPVYNPNATADSGSIAVPHDLLADNEITWWSPQLNNGGAGGTSDVVATGTAVVSLPFSNDSFYPPNGAGPNDANGFQTAVLTGTLIAPAAETVSFSVSSDDGAFVYLDGQIVCDDGGDHGATPVPCTTPTIAAGTHTLQIFYADLSPAGAALDFSVTTSNVGVANTQVAFGTISLSPAATELVGTSQAITISDPITFNGPQPTGAVAFAVNGVSYPATCSGTGQPSGQETCSAVVPAATIAALPAGAYPVTGSFAGDCNYGPVTIQTPVNLTITAATKPTLASISPAGGVTGDPATTITLTGANFATTDVMQFGQGTLATTYVNATTLTAVVPASFFATVATYPVSVTDTASNLTSGAVNFAVLTAPVVVFTGPSTATSDQQPTVTFQLVQPYAVPINCLLTLSFVPSSSAGIVDPAVQFSSGGTTINVTIPAGSTATPPVMFQTGTVAGTVTVTLTITDTNGDPLTPANVAPVVVTLPATVPQITNTTANRATGVFTVTVEGFSNTREVKTAIFHFTAAPGATLSDPDVTVDVTGIFAQWFASSASAAYGSSFTYTQPFNLNADPATIQSVTVTLVNSIGSSVVETAQ